MSSEKTEQPTPRKLRKARDKGEVFKSVDLTQTDKPEALIPYTGFDALHP